VLEAVFILLESPSPSRRIFIGSHSLPPSLVRRIGPSEDRPQALLEAQLQGQEQVRAEAKKEWWSEEEGASDGGRCE
jgi:hypothetical protein